MLYGTKNQERLIMEALVCGSHLQTHCMADRIMFVCSEMEDNPCINLLRLVYDVRICEHLQVPRAAGLSVHARIGKGVWSKLQICKLLAGEYEVACVMDTDTMAVQNLDELFLHEAPAAVFRGTRTQPGSRRPPQTYGTRETGQKQIGGINGGVVVYKPSTKDFNAMMRKLAEYTVPSQGAEQDFLTDFYRERFARGITGLPRTYNMQVHQAMLLGPAHDPQTTWYGVQLQHRDTLVKNWHFSADPKPIDFVFGSIVVQDNPNPASSSTAEEQVRPQDIINKGA